MGSFTLTPFTLNVYAFLPGIPAEFEVKSGPWAKEGERVYKPSEWRRAIREFVFGRMQGENLTSLILGTLVFTFGNGYSISGTGTKPNGPESPRMMGADVEIVDSAPEMEYHLLKFALNKRMQTLTISSGECVTGEVHGRGVILRKGKRRTQLEIYVYPPPPKRRE